MAQDARFRLKPERLIWLLLAALLAERLLIFRELGPDYLTNSDDINYIAGGIEFAKSGVISYGSSYPTALIMPGMPVVIGLMCRLVGEGTALLVAMRVLWCLLGVLSAWFVYRTGRLCSNAWGGLLAACWFLLPNMAWMNHVVLTETPYVLFSCMCVFYTFAMARSDEPRWFVGYLLSLIGGLLFRSNILLQLPFAVAWLLLHRGRPRLLLRRALALVLALLFVLTPWTLRNRREFGAFIPMTYGMGNPSLLGTYQGEGYPEDAELDYETNVHQVMLRDYAAYYTDHPVPRGEDESPYALLYDPAGEVRELKNAQFLSMQADSVKARYRLRVWWERNPLSLLKSFLYIKPRWLLNWAWYWTGVLGTSYEWMHRFYQFNMLLCAAVLALSLRLRRLRGPLLYLFFLYAGQVYLYALAFVTDRYSSTLISLRFLLAGVGLTLLPEALRRLRTKRKRGY